MHKLNLKLLFLSSLALSLFAWRMDATLYKRVPASAPETHAVPVQTPPGSHAVPQACCKGQYCWTFTPLYEYSAAGLVFGVSHKLASDFDDVMAADVGLVWGENASREHYRRVKLRVMMDHYEVFWRDGVKFNLHEAANTHLASCDDGAFAAVKKIRMGDQVRIRGWLVNARASREPGETDPRRVLDWKSSVTREDRGEGACELVYVRSAEDIEILARGPRIWLYLKWLGLAGLLLAPWLLHRRVKASLGGAAGAGPEAGA